MPAKADFAKSAAKAGDDKSVFPEKEIRTSVEHMCACLGERIATTWSFRDWEINAATYQAAVIEDAFAGGRCKPTGVLRQVLERAKRRQEK